MATITIEIGKIGKRLHASLITSTAIVSLLRRVLYFLVISMPRFAAVVRITESFKTGKCMMSSTFISFSVALIGVPKL